MVKIRLNKFYKTTGLAEFELMRGTEDLFYCCATVCLDDFVNGNQFIDPDTWFDSEEEHADKPEWFKRNELFELNNEFENNFMKFI